MTKLIALDDGHGMNTSGKRTPHIDSLGRYIPENEFNRAVVKYLNEELKRCGFKTLLTAPTDADTPLATRVNLANNAKADLFISIHYNAFDGTFGGRNPEGFSAHIDPSRGKSEEFAKIALKYLASGTKQVNRGVVTQQLYVTANTRMPAVLFELGFMDNPREALLMVNQAFQKEVAVELAKAVCEFYGVNYKAPAPAKPLEKVGVAVMLKDVPVYGRPAFGTQTGQVIKKGETRNIYEVKDGWYKLYNGGWLPSGYGKNFKYDPKVDEPAQKEVFYRVVTGSFKDRENAEFQVNALKLKGFESFLDFHDGTYRVITGSFNSRENAQERIDALKAKGFDSFIAIYNA